MEVLDVRPGPNQPRERGARPRLVASELDVVNDFACLVAGFSKADEWVDADRVSYLPPVHPSTQGEGLTRRRGHPQAQARDHRVTIINSPSRGGARKGLALSGGEGLAHPKFMTRSPQFVRRVDLVRSDEIERELNDATTCPRSVRRGDLTYHAQWRTEWDDNNDLP